MPYTTITAKSSGYIGQIGWHRMHFVGAGAAGEANAAAANMKNFYSQLATLMPSILTLTWEPTAQSFNDDGTLTDEFTITKPSPQLGGANSIYAGGVGAAVTWTTGRLNGGHKVRGRTYLVPLVSPAFEANGTLAPSTVTTIGNAATLLIAGSPPLAVNTRAKEGNALRVDATYPVSGYILSDQAAILRSRRN